MNHVIYILPSTHDLPSPCLTHAGQGYDATFSSKKNFFKYRVSPFVSGAVYVTYLVFICKMVALEVKGGGVGVQEMREVGGGGWKGRGGGEVQRLYEQEGCRRWSRRPVFHCLWVRCAANHTSGRGAG